MQCLSCCLLAASIPFRFNTTAMIVWLLALCWLLLGRFRTLGTQLKSQKIYWVWIVYYLLYAISVLYSTNKEQAGFEIVQKLSLILMPLLVGLGCFFNSRQREYVLAAFTLGVSGAALFCMGKAAWIWQTKGTTESWFYHQLVSGLDPNAVYMAWYVVFSLGLLLLFPWQTKPLNKSWVKWCLILLQFVFLVLLSSRLLLVVFFLVPLPLYLRRLYVDLKIPRFGIVLTIVAALLVVLGLAMTQNPIRQRFDDILKNDVHVAFLKDYHSDPQHFNNLTLRLFSWRVGLENIRDKNLLPYGAGLGDVQTIQNERFDAYGVKAVHDMNLHNMYLQTTMAIGLPGLLLLLAIVISPFFFVFQIPEWKSYLVFHITCCAFMMQEAVFQTQAGVVFYSFFSMLFWTSVHDRRRGRSTQDMGS